MLAAETQAENTPTMTLAAEGGTVPHGLQIDTPAEDAFLSPQSHHLAENNNTFESQSRDYNHSLEASGVS